MDTRKRVGAHLKRGKSQDKTVQSKISTEPQLPCAKACGKTSSKSRTDQLCDNCGHFADRAARKSR